MRYPNHGSVASQRAAARLSLACWGFKLHIGVIQARRQHPRYGAVVCEASAEGPMKYCTCSLFLQSPLGSSPTKAGTRCLASPCG